MKEDMKQYATKQYVRDSMDEVLVEIRSLMDVVQTEFGKVHARFTGVDADLAELKFEVKKNTEDIQRIFTYLDRMEKQLEITEQERVVMGHQIERAYAWLKQLADKLGVELKP